MKNSSGLMECDDCGKLCQGIQGIRGHRRSCPGRKPGAFNQVRQSENPVVEPEVELDEPRGRADQQVTLGSRLDAQAVEVVLHIYESVRALRERLRDSLPIREWMDSVGWTKGKPNYDDWLNLGKEVARIELATERILQQARISRDEPWALYQLAISVKDRWVSWRREEAYCTWEKRSTPKNGEDEESMGNDLDKVMTDFGIPELEANWNDVIEKLRWLTAHTRATR
jgi:hypothetical protein